MNEPARSADIAAQQAYVPWSQLWADILLLLVGFLVAAISYIVDVLAGCSEWFHRSGAVTVLLCGIVAYRSLSKHYEKLFNLPQRGTVLRTSRNQRIIDLCTLVLSILGTIVWGYGDIVFKAACK
jgi:hypothetical protein